MKVGQGASRVEPAGCIVVFSGHMIDHPKRVASGRPPRFPADPTLERQVGEEITRRLATWGSLVGICSVACGGDILFAESALALGLKLHVVLPFDRQDYYQTSVDFGYQEFRPWRTRCDRVLAQAQAVTQATPGGYQGDDSVYTLTNQLMCSLAVEKAAERNARVRGLVVIDRSSVGLPGGSGDFVLMLKRAGIDADLIELSCGALATRKTRSAK